MTITLPIEVAVNLGETLNEWASWTGWTERDDCRDWKRSPIARENRRESIVYGNCLTTIKAYLGYAGVREAMDRARRRSADAAGSGESAGDAGTTADQGLPRKPRRRRGGRKSN